MLSAKPDFSIVIYYICVLPFT